MAEVLLYWVHRAMHAVPVLWRFHRMHHDGEPLAWVTAWYMHPIDAALFATCALLGGAVAGAGVIDYAPGTGKHKGRIGALVVELPGGKRFSIGTGLSDAEREAPPKIGAVVGFRYQELSEDGVPRFPSYVGERIDVELPPARPPRAAKRKPSERVR